MNTKKEHGKIDWMITLVPLAIVIALCVLFFFVPEQSNAVLSQIRFFFGDTFGTYYLIIGLGIFIVSLYIAGSKYGNIVLGEPDEKPKYSFFAWGSMMFTCGLAADILFYSFSEWVLYATDPHIAEMGSIQDWAGVYPLFHWSFIPWGFYLVLAVAFGFMLHVRKRNRQKYSEACRPILGKHTDGWAGRIIDLLAVFALLAGTATTFSVATPLMATIIGELFHIAISRTVINIIILLITCAVYTYSLLHGFKGISKLANICIYMFFGLIAFVLLFGGETRYIVETGFASLGKMAQNFIDLSTFTDPLRSSNFPPELDNLLLGRLDGMVCGSSVFYWKYFTRKNCTSDNFGRLYIWCWINIDKFHCTWKLFNGYAGNRKGRFYCTVFGRWRSLWNDCIYYKDNAVCTCYYDYCVNNNDCILCNIF